MERSPAPLDPRSSSSTSRLRGLARDLLAPAPLLAVLTSVALAAPGRAGPVAEPPDPSSAMVAAAAESEAGAWVVGNVAQGDFATDTIRVEWGALAGAVLLEQPSVGVAGLRRTGFTRDGRFLRFGGLVEIRVLDVRGATLLHRSAQTLDLAELPARTVLLRVVDPSTGSSTTFHLANPRTRN